MTMLDGPRRTARERPLVAATRRAPSDPLEAQIERVRRRRETTSAARAIATILLALGFGALLCADSLVAIAERQPFGTTRDVALGIAEPIQSVADALAIDRPRAWLARLAGTDDLPTSAAGQDLDVPSATTEPSRPADTGTTAATLPPTSTTTTLPPRRVPTAEAPLRVAMFGDSLMGQLSLGFGRLVRDDPRVHVDADYRVSTGLARPDVLDWPAYLQQRVAELNPEVVFLAFGGNDDQDMQLADGTRVRIHTPEWRAEYARRVGLAMDVAAQGDRTVVWIGLPAERPERLNTVKDVMNEVAREQAALRPRVVFVDLAAVLTPDGAYRDDHIAPDGTVTRVRERDGVHLTARGGDVVAPALYGAIATEWNLVAPPPPPAPPATEAPAPGVS